MAGLYCLTLMSLSNTCVCQCGPPGLVKTDPNCETINLRPPRVVIEPPERTVDVGASAEFLCRTSGDGIFSMSWSDADDRNRRLETDSQGRLVFRSVERRDDGQYVCTVKGLGGETSATASLNVIGAPSTPKPPAPTLRVSIDPSGLRVKEGSTATFTCIASGGSRPRVNWVTRVQNGDFDGRTYTIRNVNQADHERVYVCEATNDEGQTASASAQLTVIVPSTPKPPAPTLRVSIDPPVLRVRERSTATFTCIASGGSRPRVNWVTRVQNGDSDGRTYTIRNVNQADHERVYVCEATDDDGQTASASAQLTVIGAQPSPLTVNVDPLVQRVKPGATAQFSCQASGGIGRLRLTWTPEVPSGRFEGQTFTVTNANRADHERTYTCEATDERGQRKTATGQLYIIESASIYLDPRIRSIDEGETATMQCRVVKGNPASISITRSDGRRLGANVEVRRTIYEDDTLIIKRATQYDTGDYICVYIGVDGLRITDTSRLSVKREQEPPEAKNVTVIKGTEVNLTCTVVDGGPLTSVSWLLNNEPIINNRGVRVSGASLTIESAQVSDEGVYTCEGTMHNSRTSSFIRLIVVFPPELTVSVNKNDLTAGETAILTCEATGRPDLQTVLWRSKTTGQVLTSRRDPTYNSDGTATLSVVHRIPSVAVSDTGMYECYAVNANGTATRTVSLNVRADPPEVTVSGGGTYQKNSRLVLNCVMTSGFQYTPLGYEWSFNGKTTLPAGVTTQAGQLNINNIDFIHEGTYACQGRNRFGVSRQSLASITVQGLPEPPKPKDPDIDITVGQRVELECKLPPGAESIRWSREGNRPLPVQSVIVPPSGEILRIPNVKPEDAGVYYCAAVRNGVEGPVVAVNVYFSPQVQISGYNPPYYEGGSLALSCDVIAGYPLPTEVKWYVNGRFFSNQKTVRVESLSSDKLGEYKCEAENRVGKGEDKVDIRFTCIKPTRMTISGARSDELYELGSSVVLTCRALGTPAPTLSWYDRAGRKISNTGNLAISDLKRSDEGTYTCRASNQCGGDSTAEERISIRIRDSPPTPPRIIGPPGPYLPGQRVTFTCTATGGFPTPSVSWWFNGRKITDQGVLTFEQLSVTDQGVYECRATNPSGTTTANVTLEMKCNLPAPLIVKPDRIEVGSTIQLRCVSSGASPTPRYTWKRDGTYIGQGETLSLTGVQPQFDDGLYTCEVDNLCGVKSAETKINVQGQRPVVKIESAFLTVPIEFGSTGEYLCTATGDPRPELSWRLGNKDGQVVSRSGILRINEAKFEDQGLYTCVAVNRIGSDSQSVQVKVRGRAPTDVRIRGKTEFQKGEELILLCEVIGDPKPAATVAWYRNEQKILTGNTLRIPSISARDEGTYKCEVVNQYGDAKAFHTVSIRGSPPPRPQIVPSLRLQNLYPGNSTEEWRCHTIPGATIEWRRRSGYVLPGGSMDPQRGTFRINSVQLEHSDSYYCVARNEYGVSDSSEEVKLNVQRAPGQVIITANPEPNANDLYDEYTALSLSCVLLGVTGRVRWELPNRVPVNDHTLRFQSLTSADTGQYKCIGLYEDGTVAGESSINIGVDQRICPTTGAIEGAPAEGYIAAGSSHSLVCQTNARPNPRIDWGRRDGRPISSRHRVSGNRLDLRDLTADDMGEYFCRVTLDRCAAADYSQKLQLIRPPTIVVVNPREPLVTPKRGSTVTLICEADGNPTPTIQWMYNGSYTLPRGVQASGNQLVVPNVESFNDGQYICEANHRFGPPATHSWFVRVNTLEPPRFPRIIVEPETKDNLFYFNQRDVVMTCIADGTEVQYRWRYRSNTASPWSIVRPSEIIRLDPRAGTLTFSQLIEEHAGDYQCEAFNEAGAAPDKPSRQIEIQLRPKVDMPDCTVHNGVICLKARPRGMSDAFRCSAYGKPPLEYEWEKSSGGDIRGRKEGTEWKIDSVQISDSGDYQCSVSRRDGEEVPDMGLFRFFVTIPPFGYSTDAYSKCQSMAITNGELRITLAVYPESNNGLIFFYAGDGEDSTVTLELENSIPVLTVTNINRQLTLTGADVLKQNQWGRIDVSVQRNFVSLSVNDVSSRPQSGSGSIRSNGDLYIMGRELGLSTGLQGAVSVLLVNDRMVDIGMECSREGNVDTVASKCKQNQCGQKGTCVPARTLQGHYCYCHADGLPALTCSDSGFSVRSVQDDPFIQKYAVAIFGQSLATFAPIIALGDGRFRVKDVVYAGLLRKAVSQATGSRSGSATFSVSGGASGIGQTDSVSTILGGSDNQVVVPGQIYPIRSGGQAQWSVENRWGDRGESVSVDRSTVGGEGGNVVGGFSVQSRETPWDQNNGYSVVSHGGSVDGSDSSYISSSGNRIIVGPGRTSESSFQIGSNERNAISSGGGQSSVGSSNAYSISYGDGRASVDQPSYSISGGQARAGARTGGTQFVQSSGTTRLDGGVGLPSERTVMTSHSSGSRVSGDVISEGRFSGPPETSGFGSYRVTGGGSSSNRYESGTGDRVYDIKRHGGDLVLVQNDQPDEEKVILPGQLSGHSASFSSDSYLQLPRSLSNWLKSGGAEFDLRTLANDGLLLFYGGSEESTIEDSEFVAIGLVDGYVEMSYRLAKTLEPTRIRHPSRVNDGQTHTINVFRRRGSGRLTVDGNVVRGMHDSSFLAAPGDIYLGGVPNQSMTGGMYGKGLVGCISEFKVVSESEQMEKIDILSTLVTAVNVSPKC